MKIKKVFVEDLDMTAGLFDMYRIFYDQTSDLASVKKFLLDRIINNESEIFLAFDEEKNTGMGFIQLYPSFSSVSMKRIWILNDLFVHKNYRMKGVAAALISRAKVLAKETNAKGLALETHNSNIDAQKLYDKTGFEIDKEYFKYYFKI